MFPNNFTHRYEGAGKAVIHFEIRYALPDSYIDDTRFKTYI